MNARPALFVVTTFLVAWSLTARLGAQERDWQTTDDVMRPRANQGHVPASPPPAELVPSVEHLPTGHVNDAPHVNHDRWYGHAPATDARFQLAHPFEHGRVKYVGPFFRHGVAAIDQDRRLLRLSGAVYFQVAVWEWPVFADWCWDCGEDFVLLDDPGHPGWYVIYNIHLGQFVHALYMGI